MNKLTWMITLLCLSLSLGTALTGCGDDDGGDDDGGGAAGTSGGSGGSGAAGDGSGSGAAGDGSGSGAAGDGSGSGATGGGSLSASSQECQSLIDQQTAGMTGAGPCFDGCVNDFIDCIVANECLSLPPECTNPYITCITGCVSAAGGM